MSNPRLPVFGEKREPLPPEERRITQREREITIRTLQSILAKRASKRDKLLAKVRLIDEQIDIQEK